jgi:organic radical activating enzyme
VISDESDWEEIQENFLDTFYVNRGRVILMPEGCTPEEIAEKREMVINMAIKHGVRYSTREHIMIWGKKIGV